jgi:hypothetical protein
VQVLSPDELFTLQSPTGWAQKAGAAAPEESHAAAAVPLESPAASALANTEMKAIVPVHE